MSRKLKLSYDAAFEEVVADSCDSFLVDSNMIENIQELNAKDKGLVSHIISFFKNLLQKVREVYAKLNPDSQEGRYVRNMKDALSELHSKWIEAVKTTSQNISNAQIDTTKNTAKNDGVKMQLREMGLDELSKQTKNNIKMRNGVLIEMMSELVEHIQLALTTNEKQTRTILQNYTSVYGTIFKRYNSKSRRFVKLTRESASIREDNRKESVRRGSLGVIGEEFSDSGVKLYQARPDISDMFFDDSDELSDNDAFLVGEYLRNNKDSNVAYHSSNNTVIFATD